MRKLKLDDASLRKLLDDLDALDSAVGLAGPGPGQFFSYRIPALRVDLDTSRDETVSHMVPSRKLGPLGIYFPGEPSGACAQSLPGAPGDGAQ